MSLVKQVPTVSGEENHFLIQSFLNQEQSEDFPFRMALTALEKLESSCSNQKELNLYMLEDIVFSSIHATFYETIFAAIKNNSHLAAVMVEQFETGTAERERIIAEQSEHHINFILNAGNCKGCPSCQHHSDVKELIPHWQKENGDFFLTLYLGMQTIQFAMEHLLYDVVPFDKTITPFLGQQDILHFRRFLYHYVETHSV